MTPPKHPGWLCGLLALPLSALWACDTPAPSPSPCQPQPHFIDADGDGFGDDQRPVEVCAGLPGFALVGGDCDDSNAARSPADLELCDNLDNDCDLHIDEDTPTLARRYRDIDQDGFGSAATFRVSCSPLYGYVDNSEDCNDIAVSVFPGADELCDEIDNDCDGEIDEALTSQLWFVDGDGDGVGSEALSVESCRPPEGFVADAGDCDDNDPARSPGHQEICNDGIDNDCDGVAGPCERRGRYALAAEENVILPDRANGYFGWSIDCRGDTDHDGLDDIIVGSGDRVFFLRGPLQGRTFAAQQGGWFSAAGRAVAFVQDINGDQGAEALRGYSGAAHLIDSPLPPSGAVSLSLTSRVGLPDALERAEFGSTLANLGDINADGLGDFAVLSARSSTNQGVQKPVLYIFNGNIDRNYSSTAAAQLLGPSSADGAPLSMASTPDITGDGQPDLFVGAPKFNLGSELLNGLVYVVASPLGTSPLGDLTDSSFRLWGHEEGSQAGFSVSDAGDVNGDGFRDVLVGAPFAREGGAARGVAYLVLGPITANMSLGRAHTRLIGAGLGDQAGWAVAGAGDVNGDGFDDVLVGAPLNSLNGAEAGAVYLFYGPLPQGNVELSQADAIFVGGEGAGGRIGSSLVGMCDINGDGFSDFMISSFQATISGAVWVIYGRGF